MIFTKSEPALGLLLATLLAAGSPGCGGGGSSSIMQPPPPAIEVSVSEATATVQPQASAKFSATVLDDSSGKGVNWSISCNGATCGSVSPGATESGIATTYTAPGPPGVTLMVTLTATSVADETKSASVAITVPVPITVSISPQSATVGAGGTQQFTATVNNDASRRGVSWSLVSKYESCMPFRGCTSVFYSPCAIVCGTISPADTGSGATMTYTAPAHFTPQRAVCFFPFSCPFAGLFVRATSVTNSGAFGQAPTTLPLISVSLSLASARVVVDKTQQFTADVSNDGTSRGVNWTLMQNGADCSPGCGTLSSTNTGSGAALTYTAPAAVPPLAVLTIAATSVEDGTAAASATITSTNASGAACGAGSGSESLLKGQYAFLVQGFFEGSGPDAFVGLGGTRGVVAIAGSFTADGTGKITAGEEDANTPSNGQTNFVLDPSQSYYSVSANHHGCLALTISGGGTTYFRFALGQLNSSSIATAGHVVEFDDTTGTGMRAAGTMRLQDPTSFTTSHLNSSYAIGMGGADSGNGRLAIAGTFALDGNSGISTFNFDIDDAGGIANLASAPGGSFTCCTVNGRGTLTLPASASAFTPNLAFYMVDASDLFLLNSVVPACTPGCNSQYGGEAIGIASGTVFSKASLNGLSVLHETAETANGPVADVALASANGNGSMTVSDNLNDAGTFTTGSNAFSYVVAANGRVTLSGGSTPPIIHLSGPNQGFLVGTDADATFGILEPQAAGPFANASFSGAYVFGSELPLPDTVTTESGVVTANGSGNAAGTLDQSRPTGLTQNQSLNFAYSFAANGVGNVGSGTTAILISDHKLVFISNPSANPTITVVEK